MEPAIQTVRSRSCLPEEATVNPGWLPGDVADRETCTAAKDLTTKLPPFLVCSVGWGRFMVYFRLHN